MHIIDLSTGYSSAAGVFGLDCKQHHRRIQGGLSSRLFLTAFCIAVRAVSEEASCSSIGTIGKAMTLMTSIFLK